MEEYTVIKKGNKVFLHSDFWGDMMVYGIKDHKPYVRRLGMIVYLTKDLEEKVYEA